MAEDWYRIANEGEIPSPALLVYPDRIFRNLERMVEIICDPNRLRPHVKTHKLPEIIGMQLSVGITKFKCATIAEAEMVAGSRGPDVLLAYQPVGPNAVRLRFLADRYPDTLWSTLVDDLGMVQILSEVFAGAESGLGVYLDLDCGMHRTGIEPGPNRLCLDLGHKAVAADKPLPRARLFGLEEAVSAMHSEEHLTVETDQADSFAVGDCCYAVPAHICPTVALHDIAWVVRDGSATQSWEISARRRSLGV